MGLKTWEYWCLNSLAIVAIALWGIGHWVGRGNQELQTERNENRAVLNRGAQINNLNNQIAQILAQAAVQNQDDALRALLADNGITISVKEEPDAAVSTGSSQP